MEKRITREDGYHLDDIIANGFVYLAVLGYSFWLFLPGTCPNRSEMATGFTGTYFQPEPAILDSFPTIFDVLGPTWK